MKKLLMLAIITVLIILPITAFSAENGTCGNNLNWTLNEEGTLTISGTGDMYDYNSTTSPAPWSDSIADIKYVEIGNGVTSIGLMAFSNCTNLSTVTMTDSVTAIGNAAFAECTKLYKIELSENITAIGNTVFNNCSNLKEITLPDGLTAIGNNAFSGCRRFNSAIPDSVVSIGNWAFSYCQALKNVVIPNSVTTIGKNAFMGCKYLESITIPKSVTTIGSDAFSNCDSLKNVYITDLAAWCNINFGNGIANPLYPSNANLYLNGSLISAQLVIPDGVTHIKGYAFYKCNFITSVVIPASVTSIDKWAFHYCNNITDFYMPINHKDTQLASVSNEARRYYCTVTYTGLIEDTVMVEYGKSVILPTPDYNTGYIYTFTADGKAWDGKNITENVTVTVATKTTVSMYAQRITNGVNYNYSIITQNQLSGTLYVAAYDNSNKLLAVKAHAVDKTEANGTLEFDGTAAYLRAFLWNDNLEPVSSTDCIIPQ